MRLEHSASTASLGFLAGKWVVMLSKKNTRSIASLIFLGGLVISIEACAISRRRSTIKPQPTVSASLVTSFPGPSPLKLSPTSSPMGGEETLPTNQSPTSPPKIGEGALPTPTPDSEEPELIWLSTASARLIAPSLAGSLQVQDMAPYIAWDDNEIYWAAGGDPGQGMSRINVLSGEEEPTFLRSDFVTGVLGASHLIIRKHWLVFLDADYYSDTFQWKIRAVNLQTGQERPVNLRTGQERVILEVHNNLSWPGPSFDFDGQRVAIVYNTSDLQKKCTVSHLVVVDVKTGAQETIEEHCADYGPFLWGPVVLHGDFMAAEQDLPDKQGNGSNLVLFHRQDRGWEEVERLSDGQNSMPQLKWPWLIWKKARRYDWGYQTMVYNLQTSKQWIIQVPQETRDPSDPALCGEWLYWDFVVPSPTHLMRGSGGIAFLYRLPNGPLLRIQQDAGTLVAFACNEHWVAWDWGVGKGPYTIAWSPITNLLH